MRFQTVILAASAVFAACAAPVATITGFSQDPETRVVTVSYTLAGEDAIVTLGLTANGRTYDDISEIAPAGGAVNRLVAASATATNTITFRPDDRSSAAFQSDSATANLKLWAVDDPPDYLVVDLGMWKNTDGSSETPDCVRYYTSTNALPMGGLANDMYRTSKLVMRRVPAGEVKWRMGSPSNETSHRAEEATHYVTLSKDFYLGIYPVTIGQMQLATGFAQSWFNPAPDRATRPAENYSFVDLRGEAGSASWPNGADPHAVEAGKAIELFRRRTGVYFDLPTEAQWEFACRAGASAMIYSGRSITVENASDPALDEIARYRFGSDLSVALANVTETTLAKDGGTAKVGSYMPNAWGFYDMIGNVSEWCLDRTPDPCAGMTAEARDPAGSVDESHKNRIVRGGGGWGGWPYNLRCAYRSGQWYRSASKTTGFRLWCPIKVTEP